jgi:protocatechuate 3,4-dioxygenase beta subunit
MSVDVFRRRLTLAALVGCLPLVSFRAVSQGAPEGPRLDLTPSCPDSERATPSAAEGPFFSPNSPARTDVTDGRYADSPFVLGGLVLGQDCRPIPNALVELWQADPSGRYDTEHYHLRGHQYTDAGGTWLFRTVRPAPYGRRVRHIHLKAQREGAAVLTTQVFFPDDPERANDRQYDPRLLMAIDARSRPEAGRFDIVLA